MSLHQLKDRASLCLFTFTDGRRCRTPRTTGHPHFCFYHARKESQARTAEKLANDLNFFLSGEYLSANDLAVALGRLIPAVVRGDLKPRAASTVAYLAQTLLQTIQVAQDEYINAFGTPEWRETIHNAVNQNWNYRNPPPPPDPAPNSPPSSAGVSPASSPADATPEPDEPASPTAQHDSTRQDVPSAANKNDDPSKAAPVDDEVPTNEEEQINEEEAIEEEANEEPADEEEGTEEEANEEDDDFATVPTLRTSGTDPTPTNPGKNQPPTRRP